MKLLKFWPLSRKALKIKIIYYVLDKIIVDISLEICNNL